MGTYMEFSIAGYTVLETKNDIDPEVMTIFREKDRQEFMEVLDENEYPEHINDLHRIYQYCAPVSVIRRRLDIMGFSIERTREDFYRGLTSHIELLDVMIYEMLSGDNDERIEIIRKQKYILENHDFDMWLKAIQEIIIRDLRSYSSFEETEKPKDISPLIEYILSEDGSESIFHIYCSDIRYIIRIFVEMSPNDTFVIQELTGLIHNGYYEPDVPICNMSIKNLIGNYHVNQKIILLAEGSSDILILQAAFEILYPELIDYYSFMNFDLSNAPGGSTALVSTIKSFIDSGISNRIIALFDNDTAGKLAKKQLQKTSIPANIKIMTYPDIDDARAYPTIGPTGVNILDVNGLACSIELYLGRDTLTQNGQLIPIQWTGYEQSLKQYQGEILDKKQVQVTFMKKVDECKRSGIIEKPEMWQSMRCLLETIFYVFK